MVEKTHEKNAAFCTRPVVWGIHPVNRGLPGAEDYKMIYFLYYIFKQGDTDVTQASSCAIWSCFCKINITLQFHTLFSEVIYDNLSKKVDKTITETPI